MRFLKIRAGSWQLRWAMVVAGLVAATGLAVWGTMQLPNVIVDKMLEADVMHQANLWNRRVVLHLEDAEKTFRSGTLDSHDREFLSLMPQASDVYRFKLFDADGRVFWSTRSSDIGTVTSKPYFQDVVATGASYYDRAEKPVAEIDNFMPQGGQAIDPFRHVAEIYTPVMKEGQFLGAVEFYTDITNIRNILMSRVRLSLVIVCGIALLALAGVSAMIFHTNRIKMQTLKARTNKERELMADQLRLVREVRLLGELNEWLQSSRSLEELFDMVARFMTHILPDAEGNVYVYSNSRDVLDGCASWNGGTHKSHIHPEGCWGLRRGRTYEFGASEIDFVCEHAEPHDGRPYFCFPILAHGETVGLLHLRARGGHSQNFHSNKQLAQMCAEQISMAIANVRMRDQLHDQSVRDPLTGLFNRRHMTECLRKSIGRSQKTGAPLSLVAVDVDHFKKFNDTHGHDAGDMVLRAVGSTLAHSCDGDEVACRIGGEEFMLILPNIAPDDVLTRAEHLRQAVESINVRYGEKTLPRITISAGIAHYPSHGTMPQELMQTADEALYRAKDKGRNQVCVAARASLNASEYAEAQPKKNSTSSEALKKSGKAA